MKKKAAIIALSAIIIAAVLCTVKLYCDNQSIKSFTAIMCSARTFSTTEDGSYLELVFDDDRHTVKKIAVKDKTVIEKIKQSDIGEIIGVNMVSDIPKNFLKEKHLNFDINPLELLIVSNDYDGFFEIADISLAGGTPENLPDSKVLSDLFVMDEKDIEKIEVVYPGDGDPYGCYVDKEEFFDIAETISLIPNRRIETNNFLFIIAIDKNGKRASVRLDEKGRVECDEFEPSSAVTSQYDMSYDDYMRLYAFLPDEATAHMSLKNPMKNYIIMLILVIILIFMFAFAIGFRMKKSRVIKNEK